HGPNLAGPLVGHAEPGVSGSQTAGSHRTRRDRPHLEDDLPLQVGPDHLSRPAGRSRTPTIRTLPSAAWFTRMTRLIPPGEAVEGTSSPWQATSPAARPSACVRASRFGSCHQSSRWTSAAVT